MELKDFIKETIKGIVFGAKELHEELEATGAIVNPPSSGKNETAIEVSGIESTKRRIQNVEFDVAVTTSSESAGSGKAGLRILVFEASVDGSHTRSNEQVSRVRFSIPLALSPSSNEQENSVAAEEHRKSNPNTRIMGGLY